MKMSSFDTPTEKCHEIGFLFISDDTFFVCVKRRSFFPTKKPSDFCLTVLKLKKMKN